MLNPICNNRHSRSGSCSAVCKPLGLTPPSDRTFTAVGDSHCRIDLLEKALSKATGQIVSVGDYIDRGDDSADVLKLLHERSDVICLAGNHEEMLFKFLSDPKRYGARRIRYGGLQDLTSFGISDASENPDEARLSCTRDRLREKIGTPLIDWPKDLSTQWTSGNVTVVHAAADPGTPIEKQK